MHPRPAGDEGLLEPPRETAIALRDGRIWLYTGDVARMDEDGFFYIVQRKKDMIIVSGFNVYPNEVEDVLFSTPRSWRPPSSAFPTRIAARRSRPSSRSDPARTRPSTR